TCTRLSFAGNAFAGLQNELGCGFLRAAMLTRAGVHFAGCVRDLICRRWVHVFHRVAMIQYGASIIQLSKIASGAKKFPLAPGARTLPTAPDTSMAVE
ncbi:MAG TPA: hypothetical protein VI685_00060, partial [Candidatus Angelobacter sp.]